MADNNISTFTPETVLNLTSLRELDLSGNNLTSIPVLILSLRNLKSLNLSNNHIRVLTNNSLLSGFEDLLELDISFLPLEVFEVGNKKTSELILVSGVTRHFAASDAIFWRIF